MDWHKEIFLKWLPDKLTEAVTFLGQSDFLTLNHKVSNLPLRDFPYHHLKIGVTLGLVSQQFTVIWLHDIWIMRRLKLSRK